MMTSAHVTINTNLCERTGNSAGVRGQARLAEVFFILIFARIVANRIGWVFMQSQIIFLLRLIGALRSFQSEPARNWSSQTHVFSPLTSLMRSFFLKSWPKPFKRPLSCTLPCCE